MKEAVQQRARQLGFEDCRITTARPPESAAHFERWLASGWQGEMAYLERNAGKRLEPRRVLPGARSLITLAASYFEAALAARPDEPPQSHRVEADASDSLHAPTPPRGLVARYARYRDYHELLGQRLQQLTEFVNELGGAGTRSLWYVDTGPLLERDLAQRAGLGFIGKHTNLISRRLGNWFFLSEILTTLELAPDASERNHCGSCTRCIAACPTGAITAPFQLDARRCISYLTIELKGPIPLHLRRAIGRRIYGCDDCLAACPWNRFAQAGRLMQEHSRPEFAAPDLLELLTLDEAAFRLRFADTPMLRAKRRGLLRNVCVALGNVGDRACLPALEKAARDPEPLIAEHAQWAMQEISTREAPGNH
jgi:epoxyqueuosine reductase